VTWPAWERKAAFLNTKYRLTGSEWVASVTNPDLTRGESIYTAAGKYKGGVQLPIFTPLFGGANILKNFRRNSPFTIFAVRKCMYVAFLH
jgi:hypothetical protein